MPLKTITFRLPEEKLQELDTLAEVQQRDRSFVLNEAVTQYLSLHEYHRALIEEGIHQADAGEMIEHEALMAEAASPCLSSMHREIPVTWQKSTPRTSTLATPMGT